MIELPKMIDNGPKITFGIIVLNGEPFIRYCLRQLYPHAHQIVVVEGGSSKAASFAPDGHSTDGTREILAAFKREEDPANKLTVIQRDGFWKEKNEQSRAYAELATGDYLWQVDVDEFYTHADIEKIRWLLASNPEISAVSFRQLPFFGGIRNSFDSFNLRADNASEYHRLFRWGEGYRYLTHRPPTVVDAEGVDLRSKRWMKASASERLGVTLYHYSLLFPKQVREKCSYYSDPGDDVTKAYAPGILRWAENCYFKLNHPFRVHNVYRTISWLQTYSGDVPEEVLRMWSDIEAGELHVEVRQSEDIEALLNRPLYRAAATLLKTGANLLRVPVLNFMSRTVSYLVRRIAALFGSGSENNPRYLRK